LYAEEVEPYKKALHYAYVFDDFSEFRKFGLEIPDKLHGDYSGIRRWIMENDATIKSAYITWYVRYYWGEKADNGTLDMALEQVNACLKDEEERLRGILLEALHASGLTQAEVQRRLGTQMAGHYFGRSQWEFPTARCM